MLRPVWVVLGDERHFAYGVRRQCRRTRNQGACLVWRRLNLRVGLSETVGLVSQAYTTVVVCGGRYLR